MAEHSYFEFACVCGIQYRVRYEGIYRCRACGRILELAWSRPALEATSSTEKTMGQPRQSIPDPREERPARIDHADVADGRPRRDDSPALRSGSGLQLLEEFDGHLKLSPAALVGLPGEQPR